MERGLTYVRNVFGSADRGSVNSRLQQSRFETNSAKNLLDEAEARAIGVKVML